MKPICFFRTRPLSTTALEEEPSEEEEEEQHDPEEEELFGEVEERRMRLEDSLWSL